MTTNGPKAETLQAAVPRELAGMRVDQAASRLFCAYSRTTLKGWIEAGRLLVDRRPVRPRDHLRGGEKIELQPSVEPRIEARPESIGLALVHEDSDLIVIDKPAGLVVHPGAGNQAGTLLNALLHYDPDLAALPRAGIVHRLDKDTSGLMVVARTPAAHRQLVREIAAHRVLREYDAVLCGVLVAGGRIEAPLGRDPRRPTRMAVVARGREAVTHYRVVRRFRGHTHARLRLETGRTHQIRVHLAHLGHPLVGDRLYGGRLAIPAAIGPGLASCLREFKRQALHASRLCLAHPRSGQALEWTSPLPPDLSLLLSRLSEDLAGAEPG